MSREWESLQGRASLGAIRLAVLLTGALAVFPAGCWLAVEHWEAKDVPFSGGLLLMVVAGLLAEAALHEARRVEAWNAEARRLRWQAENDFPPPGGAAGDPGGASAARCGGGAFLKGDRGQGAGVSEEPVEGGRR